MDAAAIWLTDMILNQVAFGVQTWDHKSKNNLFNKTNETSLFYLLYLSTNMGLHQ